MSASPSNGSRRSPGQVGPALYTSSFVGYKTKKLSKPGVRSH